jgi:NitT/TauT family transport system ATP-binding protein
VGSCFVGPALASSSTTVDQLPVRAKLDGENRLLSDRLPDPNAAAPADATAVALRGVSVQFPIAGGKTYSAVAPTDLRIGAREFVGIVGPTGCGKSTLLNVAAGLLAPANGETLVFGQPLNGLNRHAGYLFQQDAVMPWKTARDNVAIALEIAGTSRAEAVERAQGWLRRVGLAAFADRYPHQLSGGQRKRVGLAQVLIRDPKILLMDEPFGPLDAQTRQIMGNLLLELWAGDRKAVLFVTHDLEEAISLSDRVVIMSAGPEARIIGDHAIDLGRPRDASEVRLLPRFHELHKTIWSQLRTEVMKAYGGELA